MFAQIDSTAGYKVYSKVLVSVLNNSTSESKLNIKIEMNDDCELSSMDFES